MHVSFRKTQRETTAMRNRKKKWGALELSSLYGKCLHDLRSDVDIYIDLRGCSEPFLEGGAAELHNEDCVFSNEISLKFQNQQKFLRFRQISLSKMWLELW